MSSLETEGFVLRRHAIDEHLRESLTPAFETVPRSRAGSRAALDHPAIRIAARWPQVRALVEPVLGPSCFAVRALLFDKTPVANWKVPLHQDLALAVSARREVPGFGPWSLKRGVLHVQAPSQVLATMVSLRIHVDPCVADDGPLRVVPGSHLAGRRSDAQLGQYRLADSIPCLCDCGDVLLMRPLLVHGSSKARIARRRRVLHLEFAASCLPGGLVWAVQV